MQLTFTGVCIYSDKNASKMHFSVRIESLFTAVDSFTHLTVLSTALMLKKKFTKKALSENSHL